ncbi:succinylglutamate desuccinylase/aspartoacylase family protein [Marinobacter sp. ELB17]|uniref:succinylglutamate desuccinylase/aspartoacylase family protein n=1 Tax=Marinobacter sp. ELB17 TaxID=270374 RepID=UPI0000F36E11|nr:succinylglutamate desuccinylase/aspartoacylase family protein [Marinobacter sp. ELB17]EBA01434.1 deacylase-like protein [Marinobacter sp. ELB17]
MASKHGVMMAFWQHLARRSLASAVVVAGAFGALSAQADGNSDGDTLVADLDSEQAPLESQPAASRSAPDIDLKEVAPPPAAAAEPASPDAGAKPLSDSIQPASAVEAPKITASFSLLGSDIRPGISTRLAWSPNIQIAGLSQPTPVLVVNGINPGPTLCLTSAIHGDELNGIEIVRRTLYDLDATKLSGRVVGVPIVNLPGFEQGSRYLPDRRDLNRHFPGSANGSLADRIAHSLFTQVINHCDMLVDIHTGSQKRTNLPQLRADMNNPDVAAFTLGFDRMAVVHSSGSPGMLRTAAVNAGIRAVTLEVGESHRIQEHQIEAGVNSLISLLEKQEMISRMFVWGAPEPVYYDSLWVRVDHGGILFSKVGLGDKVNKGDLMGHVTDPITNAQYPVRATRSGRLIGMAVDQVVMAGFAAYHLGTKPDSPEFHINGELDHADSAGRGESVEAVESGDDLIDNDG